MYGSFGVPELVILLPIVVWLSLGLLAAYVARQKGRDGCGWFLLALLFSPLALPALIAVPALPTKGTQDPVELGQIQNGALFREADGTVWLMVDGERRSVPDSQTADLLQAISYAQRVEWLRERDRERASGGGC